MGLIFLSYRLSTFVLNSAPSLSSPSPPLFSSSFTSFFSSPFSLLFCILSLFTHLPLELWALAVGLCPAKCFWDNNKVNRFYKPSSRSRLWETLAREEQQLPLKALPQDQQEGTPFYPGGQCIVVNDICSLQGPPFLLRRE